MDFDSIRFGIPEIDGLFGGFEAEANGIHLPRAPEATSPSSVSICITGPGGTGKSILALHLAARYLADRRSAGDSAAKVLYVSTDLKYEVAHSQWRRFRLNEPDGRARPFTDHAIGSATTGAAVELVQCHPLQSPEEKQGVFPLSRYLAETTAPDRRIYFVDLASHTAGDDWGFVSRVLSVIDRVAFPHLMIIDSVEGFETLVGERDAFGESQTRRSRVAQILRSAGDKCHIVFIVEEPQEGEHLPEEFVTDVVIRLRSVVFRDYGRRTIEIVKARGQSHVRGQHILLIRSGSGSRTGSQVNHDDPAVTQPGNTPQSYVHVCPSLHRLNRSIMEQSGEGLPQNEPAKYAAFGIRYLDDMLASKTDDFRRDAQGDDQRGLRCRTTTALIGNSQTQKSPLGYAFLSRCFRLYAEEFAKKLASLSAGEVRDILRKVEDQSSPPGGADDGWQSAVLGRLRRRPALSDTVIAAALSLGPPREEQDGIPVLLTTHDIHAESLVKKFTPWLLRKVPDLRTMDGEGHTRGCVDVLEDLMVERSICRRLEIHDMPSAVLVHIVQRSIEAAQLFLFKKGIPKHSEARYERSSSIRVVIDDLSILRDTYAEIRDDPLLLRCLVFLLGREGVTTLLIDTQEGHPHLTVPGPLDSELRTLVANHIYTWRFPFYDGNRVAIAAIPSMRPQAPTVIRELREGSAQGAGLESAPLVVDHLFELYSGIETGQPKPIPLKICLYEEMPAFKGYIADQNTRCMDLFTPLDGDGERKIICGIPAMDYRRLSELVSTQRDALLDHALIFQVDEFWAMKRPGVRPSGASRPVWDYLNAKSVVESRSRGGKIDEPHWAVDPFGWFQRTAVDLEQERSAVARKEPYRRKEVFVTHGYSLMQVDENEQDLIDRVPFMWDFGFLLCRIRAWEDKLSSKRPLTFLRDADAPGEEATRFKNVGDVWDSMPLATKDGASRAAGGRPSWRVFLEACFQLAQAQTYSSSRPTPAFDVHVSAPPGLSCLILEIWASEILKDMKDEEQRQAFRDLMSRRKWDAGAEGLIEWLTRYQRQLFRTWLLLVEVLDLRGFATAITEGRLATREPNPTSLAVRHWYKTAWAVTQDLSIDDPVVPAGLPGHFSVRGDWFLSVAGGSRSELLANQALDFLNTRTAMYERLSRGLGLPVRRIITDNLRTGIITFDRGDRLGGTAQAAENAEEPGDQRRRVSRVLYDNLIRLGGQVEGLSGKVTVGGEEPDFHWLWRSRLAHFARHARIWHGWLSQTIVWWSRMREVQGADWMNGFKRYDSMAQETEEEQAFAAWRLFRDRCDHFVRELKDAALP